MEFNNESDSGKIYVKSLRLSGTLIVFKENYLINMSYFPTFIKFFVLKKELSY